MELNQGIFFPKIHSGSSISNMMQVQDEIEDLEGYCMLKIEKIEPIHGSLRQGVQMGHIKPDRAEELKSK